MNNTQLKTSAENLLKEIDQQRKQNSFTMNEVNREIVILRNEISAIVNCIYPGRGFDRKIMWELQCIAVKIKKISPQNARIF